MVIHMTDVTYTRDRVNILTRINWTVRSGEHWAILGLNGSGKTTLLNMINGYIWPSKGELSVLGHKFGTIDLRELRKSIGWVSSSLQEKLYGSETAEEITLSGKFATIGLYDPTGEKDLAQALSILEQLGCGPLAKRPYKTLSQGEKQKILIARALMSSPELLILDEPCNGLDFFSREMLLATIEQMGKQSSGPTLLYVTHHLEEILPIFSHTMLLREGEIFSAGKTNEILTGNNISQFFAAPVDILWQNQRAWMRLACATGLAQEKRLIP